MAIGDPVFGEAKLGEGSFLGVHAQDEGTIVVEPDGDDWATATGVCLHCGKRYRVVIRVELVATE